MKFEDAPIVPTPNVFREARVSSVHGKAVLEQLAEAGSIDRFVTATKRVLLTTPHAKVLFEELTSSR